MERPRQGPLLVPIFVDLAGSEIRPRRAYGLGYTLWSTPIELVRVSELQLDCVSAAVPLESASCVVWPVARTVENVRHPRNTVTSNST